MKRIQKVSSYIQILVTLLLFAWPFFEYFQWTGALPESFFGSLLIQTPDGLVDLNNPSLPQTSRLVCILAHILAMIPTFLGLLVIRQLFGQYKKGNIFSLQNIHHFKKIGWLFLLEGLFFAPISEMIEVLGASLSYPPGHRSLILSFGALNIESILGGSIIFVIAWIMEEAYTLHEDHTLTI